MIIEKIAVENFRVFSGRHEFELAPRDKYNKKAPIILFGGLNGAGKTSILTAVLATLYGRQSLGPGTSQAAYEKFLIASIHKSANALIPPNSALLEMTFTFSNMGTVANYTIQRSWSHNGKKLDESLVISKNDKQMRDLSADQAQAFLNELIPIGVSDLFFFDGEKIKDLAEDKTGKSLADAIRKLLGLDLIGRLGADLTLLIRDKEKQTAEEDLKEKIDLKEMELAELESSAAKMLDQYEQLRCSYVEANSEVDRINGEMQAEGGAWISSRETIMKQHAESLAEKKATENQLREKIGSSYPFALMKKFTSDLVQRLEAEQKNAANQGIAKLVQERQQLLPEKLNFLSKKDLKKVEAELKALFEDVKADPIIESRHDLTPTQSAGIVNQIQNAESSSSEIKLLVKKLKHTEIKLDEAGVALSRAPDERSLQSKFDELTTLSTKANGLKNELNDIAAARKKVIYKAIETARSLRDVHEALSREKSESRSLKLSKQTRAMLEDFSENATKERVAQLETEFVNSFERLARKDDAQIQAKIDPSTFDVTLVDKHGNEINKNDLSAGEKQIYAISILEALARTSGRNLPIIIDTPLGRLDSKHRQKLGENYFPYASQQVIILSTDTEVDESFYKLLEKHISHCYELEYDANTQSTNVNASYFWKTKRNAA